MSNDKFEFSIVIDQTRMILWGLSFREAALLSYFRSCWSRFQHTQDGVWIAKTLLLREMPALTNSHKIAQRLEKSLIDKGLIVRRQVGKKMYYTLTEKAADWGRTTGDDEIRKVREIQPEIVILKHGKTVRMQSHIGGDVIDELGGTEMITPLGGTKSSPTRWDESDHPLGGTKQSPRGGQFGPTKQYRSKQLPISSKERAHSARETDPEEPIEKPPLPKTAPELWGLKDTVSPALKKFLDTYPKPPRQKQKLGHEWWKNRGGWNCESVADEIMAALNNQLENCSGYSVPRYCPNPVNYLAEEMWRDKVVPAEDAEGEAKKNRKSTITPEMHQQIIDAQRETNKKQGRRF